MTDWVVWYADGSSYSSDDGHPGLAPRSGVACIAVASQECGRYILAEQNYYCWHRAGGWVPHDRDGLEQYLDDIMEPGIRLRGYWTSRDLYQEIRRAAKMDERLPKVTANPPREPEGA